VGRRRGSRLEDLVASRYRRAGYEVRKHVLTRLGEIDVLARRGRTRIAVEAKAGRQVITSSIVRKFYRKARHIRARPVLGIGPRTRATKPAKDLAKKLGVAIRVVRIRRGRRR